MLISRVVRAGQPYGYYVCALARKSKGQACSQPSVAAAELEASLTQHLEPMLGEELSAPILQQALARVAYDGVTRRVLVVRRDGTRSEYTLAGRSRGALQSTTVESEDRGRIPRISRLVALAIKLERLLRDGTIESHRAVAEVGQISRSRMSQILTLADLAPSIQEAILFLPRTITGRDPITEAAVRPIAREVDWEWQVKQFRSLMDSTQTC